MKGKNKCDISEKYKTLIMETKIENEKTEEDLERQAIYAFKCVKRKMMLEAMMKTMLMILIIYFFAIFGKYIRDYIVSDLV